MLGPGAWGYIAGSLPSWRLGSCEARIAGRFSAQELREDLHRERLMASTEGAASPRGLALQSVTELVECSHGICGPGGEGPTRPRLDWSCTLGQAETFCKERRSEEEMLG